MKLTQILKPHENPPFGDLDVLEKHPGISVDFTRPPHASSYEALSPGNGLPHPAPWPPWQSIALSGSYSHSITKWYWNILKYIISGISPVLNGLSMAYNILYKPLEIPHSHPALPSQGTISFPIKGGLPVIAKCKVPPAAKTSASRSAFMCSNIPSGSYWPAKLPVNNI